MEDAERLNFTRIGTNTLIWDIIFFGVENEIVQMSWLSEFANQRRQKGTEARINRDCRSCENGGKYPKSTCYS